jgi:NAD(P)H-hydrate epimerase
MKIFNTSQIRELDRFTIENEPIASIDLMERAAFAIYEKYMQTFHYNKPVYVFAGPGNNGGDVLALARLLLQTGLNVKAQIISAEKLSPDCETNLKRLKENFPDAVTESVEHFAKPDISSDTIIVDGLFGSGLARPLSGIFAEAVEWINDSGNTVVSIDIPSGLQGESVANENDAIVKADYTFSLQFPKLSFFFPENERYVGKWSVLDIGIHPKAIDDTFTKYILTEKQDIQSLIKPRKKFSHKGTFGHLLLVAGGKGMAGASVLGAKAALRSGAGLVTVHGPKCNRVIVQTAVPEAIFSFDNNKKFITAVYDLHKYSAIAVGPGIGVNTFSKEMLAQLLTEIQQPCVFDADALNLFGFHPELLELLPKGSIITPHKKEFERMFGTSANSSEELKLAIEKAKEFKIVIVLKGAYTRVILPFGNVYFNPTGNAGMATGGSGDVLTGIIGSLLAQGYNSESAALAGVYLHGLAADLGLETESEVSLIAGDIVEKLGKAFKEMMIGDW